MASFLGHLYSKTGQNVNLIVQGPRYIAGGAHQILHTSAVNKEEKKNVI